MRMGLHTVITGKDFTWMMLPDETVEDWLLPDKPYHHHQVSCSCCILKHISFCALKWSRCYIKPLCTSLPVHIQLKETSWADICVGLFFGLFKQYLQQHLNPFMICAVTGDISSERSPTRSLAGPNGWASSIPFYSADGFHYVKMIGTVECSTHTCTLMHRRNYRWLVYSSFQVGFRQIV